MKSRPRTASARFFAAPTNGTKSSAVWTVPRTKHRPEGQRKRRRLGLRARPLSSHALQGTVDEAAGDGGRDSRVHQRARGRAEGQAGIVTPNSRHLNVSRSFRSFAATPALRSATSLMVYSTELPSTIAISDGVSV